MIKLTIIVDRALYEPFLPAHIAYLKELKARGALLLSGPFTDRKGGMVLVQADSREAAEAIAQADPLVANRVDSYELREWLITDGKPEDIVVQRVL
ncbi:MAG TPA: YciI family protein [Roseiflexaceae bacterium]|nr:YciI family protein [Roseiflexaceae bacterium]